MSKVRCLKDTSGKEATDEITFLLHSRLKFPPEWWRNDPFKKLNWENFSELTFTSFSCRLILCLIWGAPFSFFRTRAVLFTMAFPRKKRDRFEVKISPFWLDGVIVCTPSGPILDEFPQRPSRYYFALNRKLIFDRAFVSFTWQPFFIQSTSWSQDGDMIIHMSWNEKRKDR